MIESNRSTISEIYRDIAQVFFASIFAVPLSDQKNINWIFIFEGLVLSIIFWLISLLLAKQLKPHE